jgi:hypothetical protein
MKASKGFVGCASFVLFFVAVNAAQAQYQPSPDSGVPGLIGAPGLTGTPGLGGAPDTQRPDPYMPYPSATPYSPPYEPSPYQPNYGSVQNQPNPFSAPDDNN